jgi:hypothetical protein
MNVEPTEFEHPAFPQPSDARGLVWRYMDFAKFEWLVENSKRTLE